MNLLILNEIKTLVRRLMDLLGWLGSAVANDFDISDDDDEEDGDDNHDYGSDKPWSMKRKADSRSDNGTFNWS